MLVDVREADEHAREKIPGARHLPLSKLDEADLALPRSKPVLFHCRSGARTLSNAGRLAAKAGECDAYIVTSGLDARKRTGLPVVTDHRQRLELQRQVQIGAGSRAFTGTLLGLFVSLWFLGVPLFVGSGLILAWSTDGIRAQRRTQTGS